MYMNTPIATRPPGHVQRTNGVVGRPREEFIKVVVGSKSHPCGSVNTVCVTIAR
jgi:hypothetical protein